MTQYYKALPTVYFQAIKSTIIFLAKTAGKIYMCNTENIPDLL